LEGEYSGKNTAVIVMHNSQTTCKKELRIQKSRCYNPLLHFHHFFIIFIFMVFRYMMLASEALHRCTLISNVAVLAESISLKCFVT